MAPVFGYAWGLLVDTPTQNAPLWHMPPNLNIQNPKFKIQLFNGLRPGEKRAEARGEEPAAHGGEECAARMVKTKADALGIGSQAPILLSK